MPILMQVLQTAILFLYYLDLQTFATMVIKLLIFFAEFRYWSSCSHQKRKHSKRYSQEIHYVSVAESNHVHAFRECDTSRPQGKSC